jgi:rhamnulokinase
VRLFGEIVEPATRIGAVQPSAVAALAGTTVVAPACHDTGSAVAAVRASGDTAFLSSGTWSLLGTEVQAPVITARGRDLNFTNEGGVGGTTRLLKNIVGLWLLQACRQRWIAGGVTMSYDDLVSQARDHAEPFRTLLDVDDPSFLNPSDMPAAIVAFAHRTGQPAPAGPAAFTRCILESLALKYRDVVDALGELTGQPIRVIRLVGGGAKNAVLSQFTADATGRTVLAGPVEATALGNVAVQMVATGHAATIDHAREIIERSFPVTRYEPRDTDVWERHRVRLGRPAS